MVHRNRAQTGFKSQLHHLNKFLKFSVTKLSCLQKGDAGCRQD